MTTHVATHHHAPTATADYRAGALAGLGAGVVMSFIMMAMTTFMMGMGPWAAAKMAWTLVAGKEVMRPGFELVPVMGGMAVHFGLSALFGLIYAWLTTWLHMGYATLGFLFGLGLYVTNILIVPTVFPEWAGHMFPPNPMMHVLQAIEHGIFGLVVGSLYSTWHREPRIA